MKSLNKFALSVLVAPMLLGLAGCSGMSRQDNTTAIGGAVLTGVITTGTVGGAAIGGIIGHQIDEEHTNPHG